jgi:transketolase
LRDEACRCWQDLFIKNPFVFLTGDLGFGALEPLREVMGASFINAGVAEQNMISVAAGMASQGCNTWVYSIAPFCYARPFEQIRNDICLHNFPVKIVGNGGGYGYGSMGASHHALEDYGTLLTLNNMQVYVPAFAADIFPVIHKLAYVNKPAYLRLGRCEKSIETSVPPYAPLRKLRDGKGPVLLVIGPLAGGILTALQHRAIEDSPELWLISELPLQKSELYKKFIEPLRKKERICVVEEHVAPGGLGQMIAHFIVTEGLKLKCFRHLYAKGYPSGNYGSQAFHRCESGIDPQTVLQVIDGM